MVDLSELVEAGKKKLREPRVTAAQDTPSAPSSPPRSAFDEMFPPERIEAIKKKELRRFKAAQDKKWQNWRKSVAEDVSPPAQE